MIFEGKNWAGDVELRTEVLVVGSGSGGAVAAREMAEAGRDVIILEEGRYIRPETYGAWRPSESLRWLGRSGGTTVALGLGDSPTINILAGSCVGGSSVMTGGVCFRIPSQVHQEWVDTLGIADLSEEAMRPFYERVEAIGHVAPVPVEMRSRGTQLFGEGLQARGLPELQPIHRNTKGCCGCSRCNFGCPHQAKQSVDLTYLPRALQRGAQIYADFRVDRILSDGRRVTGVEGMILRDPDRKPFRRFVVKADLVILAAGSLHTPLLLMRSGIFGQSGQVGRGLTLHPAFRVGAVFDQPVQNWKGALQSAYTHHPTDHDLIFISVMAPISVLTATFHGGGPAWMKKIRENAASLATFGGMVHDAPGGRIWRGPGREPLITYRLTPQNKDSMLRGMRFLAETFLSAGAKELLFPIIGFPALRSFDDLKKLDPSAIPGSRLECFSFHPLGTCRIGTDPKRAVVDPHGQLFDLENLYIADGSILPTSVGVNTQIPVMAMASRVAFAILDRSPSHRRVF